MKFMRRPDQQVLTWKAFIGPSIKAATLDEAPPDIQKLVQEHWRPEYTDMEKKYKIVYSGRQCSRSEEHTSELQSQSNLVCRLLLEKKKKKKKSRQMKTTA